MMLNLLDLRNRAYVLYIDTAWISVTSAIVLYEQALAGEELERMLKLWNAAPPEEKSN